MWGYERALKRRYGAATKQINGVLALMGPKAGGWLQSPPRRNHALLQLRRVEKRFVATPPCVLLSCHGVASLQRCCSATVLQRSYNTKRLCATMRSASELRHVAAVV